MKMSFGSRRGGSCLIVLIVLALVGALIFVIARLNAVESEREEERRAKEAKPVEKSPEQLKRERINEMLSDKAPDLGPDPSKALVDGNIKTMKSVRDQTVNQQATIKSRLKNADSREIRLDDSYAKAIFGTNKKWISLAGTSIAPTKTEVALIRALWEHEKWPHVDVYLDCVKLKYLDSLRHAAKVAPTDYTCLLWNESAVNVKAPGAFLFDDGLPCSGGD